MPKPSGTEIEFGGLYEVHQESLLGTPQELLGSIVLIFIVPVLEFRSFSHRTATVVATLLGTSGALVALYITGTMLKIYIFFYGTDPIDHGGGHRQKNGISMLNTEKHLTAEGYELRGAICHAGWRRLRPILMTALATMFGMLPLAWGVGSGAQMLQPLAIAVIGGVGVSMVLSQLITPVLLYLLRKRG